MQQRKDADEPGRERTLPVVLGTLALASLLLLLAARLVADGHAHAFDTRLLLLLRTPGDPSDPLGPAWLEEAVRDITALGSNMVLTLVVLAAGGFLLLTGRTATALTLVLSVAAGLLLTTLAKLGFDRPRPDLVAHGMKVYTRSFPSSHAAMSAIVYLTLGAMLARTWPDRPVRIYVIALAIALTLLVGLSRVYLGVHWPTDVLAGWALGATWALACWLALARWHAR